MNNLGVNYMQDVTVDVSKYKSDEIYALFDKINSLTSIHNTAKAGNHDDLVTNISNRIITEECKLKAIIAGSIQVENIFKAYTKDRVKPI